jgi:hypothetical protein
MNHHHAHVLHYFLISILSLGILLGSGIAKAGPQGVKYMPQGSFMQDWMMADWTEADWEKEIKAMKELGLDIIILQNTADTKNNTAIYDTRIPGYKGRKGGKDMVEAVFRQAKKHGMKVMLGLNANDDWWKKYSSDPKWLNAEMEKGNVIADDLKKNYIDRYPNQFFGWYWWWEVDNYYHQKPENWENLANAISINCRHLHKLTPGKPVMICPFANCELGKPETYGKVWNYVIPHSELAAGDILCPQDGLGGEVLNTDNFTDWFKMYKKAVDMKQGVQLWSDLETFGKDERMATIGRIEKQIENVQPYVTGIITFSYNHYQGPHVAPAGFHKTWLEYVKTGKLETVPPTTPKGLKVIKLKNGSMQLTWNAATDNMGILGYKLFRDGKIIKDIQLPKKLEFVDDTYKDLKKAEYRVSAYDFAGNGSLASQAFYPGK